MASLWQASMVRMMNKASLRTLIFLSDPLFWSMTTFRAVPKLLHFVRKFEGLVTIYLALNLDLNLREVTQKWNKSWMKVLSNNFLNIRI